MFRFASKKNDILLLNSDTEVTSGFLEEMKSVLYADNKHGTVSPRSNNATIATIPVSSIVTHKTVSLKKSYKIYKNKLKKLPKYTEVPTAHGFCMLIKRELINEHGLFDEIFGKGYGEEVDFCQRIRKDGFKCLLSNHSYVFHYEAKSFTHKTKSKLIESSSKIINKRYPNYNKEVHDYIQKAIRKEDGFKPSKPNYVSRAKALLKRKIVQFKIVVK